MRTRLGVRFGWLAAMALVVLLLAGMRAPNAEAAVATFFVDTTLDDPAKVQCMPQTFDDCSLRGAIIRANANNNTDVDVISFAMFSNPNTIATIPIFTSLPTIDEPVNIDGATAGADMVEVISTSPTTILGFQITSSNVTINALAIGLFKEHGIKASRATNLSALTGITLTNNYVGVDKGGTLDRGNGQHGILISGNIDGAVIAGNLIGGNGGWGISNEGGDDTIIRDNFIGMTHGEQALGNDSGGVRMASGQEITIGGAAGDRNYIGGNTGVGVQISVGGSAFAEISHNYIGMSFHAQPVPNTQHGVVVAGNYTDVLNNIISGNGMNGVRVVSATQVVIAGNLIGLASGGEVEIPNGANGVEVIGLLSGAVRIGGPNVADRNIISGNDGDGVMVNTASSQSNVDIVGNYVGTDADGEEALGNLHGISVFTPDVEIKGNVASANAGNGINLEEGADNTVVAENFIGTNATGTAALGNGDIGVNVNSINNKIGDGDLGDHNVISGNFYGIDVSGPGPNFIRNNHIGVDFEGTSAIPNHAGIRSNGENVVIGEDFGQMVAKNIISGNENQGISIGGGNALIRQNTIGRGADFSTILPNETGIQLVTSDSGVYNNNISGNLGVGIEVGVGTNNGIANNEIQDNGGLGVDLDSDGPTLNDTNDTDTGTNNLQNFPEIVAVYPEKLHWTLDTVPGRSYIVTAVIADGGCDPSGFGEGGDLVHEEIFEDITGDLDVTWQLASKEQPAIGEEVTMLASVYLGDIDEYAGDTSEFAECKKVIVEPPATPTPTPGPPTPTPSTTQAPTPTATPTATATTPVVTPTHSTFTSSPTPTGTPSDTLVQGDITCDGDIDEDDFALLLEFLAELTSGEQDAPCPDVGEGEPISGFEWGDVNCDGGIDGLDAVILLLFHAEADLPEAEPGCVAIGGVVS